MTRIVLLTIGEAPRSDIEDTYNKYFAENLSVSQCGILDDLTFEEAEMKFGNNDNIGEMLTSRFRDGQQIVMCHDKVEKQIQLLINELEMAGTEIIGLLCTGEFNQLSSSRLKIISAEEEIIPFIKKKYDNEKIGLITPLKVQIRFSIDKWNLGDRATFTHASPYQFDLNEFINAAQVMIENNVDVVILDCIGYSQKMKDILSELLPNQKIILSNDLFFKILKGKYL